VPDVSACGSPTSMTSIRRRVHDPPSCPPPNHSPSGLRGRSRSGTKVPAAAALTGGVLPQTYLLKLARSGEDGEKVFLVLESGTRFHTTQVLRCTFRENQSARRNCNASQTIVSTSWMHVHSRRSLHLPSSLARPHDAGRSMHGCFGHRRLAMQFAVRLQCKLSNARRELNPA